MVPNTETGSELTGVAQIDSGSYGGGQRKVLIDCIVSLGGYRRTCVLLVWDCIEISGPCT